MLSRRVAVVGSAAMAVSPAIAAQSGTTVRFPTKDHEVRTTYFRAPGNAKRPTALILHGAGGFERARAGYEKYAAVIADAGIDAIMVNYYSKMDESAVTSMFEQRYESWAGLVSEIAADVMKRPDSNGKVGLIGFSNGGILATGIGALDPKIAAAVIYYGTEPCPLNKAPTRFPPMLILHGDADDIIPVNQGRRLAQIAQKLGGNAELVIYPDGKHGFGVRDDEHGYGADSLKRTIAFLTRELA